MDILTFKNSVNFQFTDDKDLLEKLQKFYTVDGYTPKIEISGNIIHVHIDDAVYRTVKKDFDKATDYCNNHRFDKAEPILKDIIKRCPLHSDSFRILGQIEMGRENYDKAIDYVLSALVIDPTNVWSLVLMGNLYANKGNLEISDTYYNKVLEYHPDDIMALNNIGGNYIRYKKYDDAIKMFKQVLSKDDSYLNSYYGLAMCYYDQNRYEDAIEVCIEGMKKGVNRPQDRNVREEIQKMVMSACRDYVKNFDYSIEIGIEKKKLSEMSNMPLRIEEDRNLNVHARMEYHVTRHRNYDRVVFNPTKPYHEHLLMHEFMHLEMANEASKNSSNKIAVTGKEEAVLFRKWLSPELSKLRSKLTSDHLDKLVDQLLNGIMLQATNSPLDLLVEDRIYKNYPKMRPLQILSLVEMEINNVDSVTKASNSDIPKKIVSSNRIMNIVSALHLQDLYGFNIAPHYKPTPNEKKIAEDLYEEYKAYKDDYKPGEEYNLLVYFVENLGLDKYFRLVNEMHFKDFDMPAKETLPEECIDPESHDEQNAAFAENHGDSNPVETMMMSMYMLGALQYMDGMPHEDIHRIAIEIAIVGMRGINPNNNGYSISAIPNKEFGGYEFLAYYYVSWALAIPEKVDSLGLPFKSAYEAAKQMFEKRKGK